MTGWYVLIFAAACWLPVGAVIDALDVNPERWLAAHAATVLAALAHLIDLTGRPR